jgi:hypothetical protein
MNFKLSERARVLVSGLVAGTITSLLMFTVAEALSPENLMRRDAASDVMAAAAPLATDPRRDA